MRGIQDVAHELPTGERLSMPGLAPEGEIVGLE